MKIHYWGTAAAEGIPAIFCGCPTCRNAREKKGREVRTRSQLMIDDTLLVDFGPDTYAHALQYDCDLSRLENVLVTHVHGDHFSPVEFTNRQEGFSHNMAVPTLHFHGAGDMEKNFLMRMGGNDAILRQKRVAFLPMAPYETRQIGGCTVTALPANHGTEQPYVYAIYKGEKSFLLLNDTSMPCDGVFDWLKESGLRFGMVSYDCTFAIRDTGTYPGHMGFPNNLQVRDRLARNGNLAPDAIHVSTHFTHNAPEVSHAQMEALAKEHGFLIAYDGMVVEI